MLEKGSLTKNGHTVIRVDSKTHKNITFVNRIVPLSDLIFCSPSKLSAEENCNFRYLMPARVHKTFDKLKFRYLATHFLTFQVNHFVFSD